MSRLLAVSVAIMFIAGCSSDPSTTPISGNNAPDVVDLDTSAGDADLPDVEGDAGLSDVGPECVPARPGPYCDGQRIVECADGVVNVIGTCSGGCQEVDDEPVCSCATQDECGGDPAGDQRCIEGMCRPDPCLGAGDRYCDAATSVSCNDGASLDCAGGCADGRCLCDTHEACPDLHGCVQTGASAGTCRLVECEAQTELCEGRVRVHCDEGGLSVTELEVCHGVCIDDGNGLARCGCAGASHCGGNEYCDAGGECQTRECEPSSAICHDVDNAVVRCDDIGLIAEVEPCGDLNCVGGACLCEEDSQCDEAQFCDFAGECRDWLCNPTERLCTGVNVAQCNAQGSAPVFVRSCPTGTTCDQGECLCDDTGQCADGESCADGACLCESDVFCDERCCESGHACISHEICEDGLCNTLRRCLVECENGQRCGNSGELCCGGDTPVCDPRNVCVPDCGANRALCGENLDFCCEEGDLCLFDSCRSPGVPCTSFSDCDFGEYCEPTLGSCLPDEFPDGVVCELDYDFDDFEPEILWHWQGVEINGLLHKNVAMTPVVADMTGNGIPNVAFNAYPSSSSGRHAPTVIDGETGETIYVNATRWASSWTQLALVDITGNGLPEMVMQSTSGVGVIKDLVTCPAPSADDDCYLWWRTSANIGVTPRESQIVADMNADGNVEIIVNNVVLNGLTGDVIASAGGRGYDYTVVADITGDGKMELLSHRCLLALNSDLGVFESLWCNSSLPAAGMIFAAVGDVVTEGGRAGEPEFVITGNGQVYVVAADTGALLHQFAVPGGGNGGPPIIADFDGDGRAEFGIPGRGCYTVFDLDCLGPVDQDLEGCIRPNIPPCTQGVDCFEVESCPALAGTGGSGNGILWSVYIQDISSSRTGSSVFDFQGNGRNEVVYNDECLLLVFDGQNGRPLFRHPNTTRTASEYPIVVDVNGDSRTNIVVAGNNDQFTRDCRTPIQNRPDRYPECHENNPPAWCTQGTAGILALQDPEDRWVRTRKIWNQFAYHIDNVTDDARAPISPTMPWETHNTFRANRQGEIPLNSPNPSILSLSASNVFCPPEITLNFVVGNPGTRGIPPGLPISIYRTDTAVPEYIQTVVTTEPLLPGGVIPFQVMLSISVSGDSASFRVVANDDGQGGVPEEDCDEDSATADLVDVPCLY